MSKTDIRESMRENCAAVGDVNFELTQLEKVQYVVEEDIVTITVGCGTLFTLVCC